MFKNEIVSDIKNSCTYEHILKIEEQYNFKFPEEIKLFYLQYNGGKPKKTKVYLQYEDWNNLTNFHGFYTINSEFEERLQNVYNEDWWSKYLIPFGYDEGGEDFCFSINPSDYGSIYYFMSDCVNELNPIDAYVKVSDSFSKFINSMEE